MLQFIIRQNCNSRSFFIGTPCSSDPVNIIQWRTWQFVIDYIR
jgi:hypothetical protein